MPSTYVLTHSVGEVPAGPLNSVVITQGIFPTTPVTYCRKDGTALEPPRLARLSSALVISINWLASAKVVVRVVVRSALYVSTKIVGRASASVRPIRRPARS